MKLQNEYNYVKEKFSDKIDKIKGYSLILKQSNEYKDFEVRLAWDCLRAFIGSNVICNWYDKYDCHDAHITTLAKRVLKDLGVLKNGN